MNSLQSMINEAVQAEATTTEVNSAEPVVSSPEAQAPTTEQTEQTPDISATPETILAPESANQQVETAIESPSRFANEELAEANAYLLKNSGKTLDDYKALKTPTESLNEETLMRQYLSEKEGKSEASIAYALKKLELTEVDEDFEDDFLSEEDNLENLKRKADREELIQKAREWREDFVKSELSFNNDSQESQNVETQQPAKTIEDFINDAKVAQDEYMQNHRTKVYEAVADMNHVELDILGTPVHFIMDENFKTEMRRGAEDVASIGKEFFDEKGNIVNAKSFIQENTLWANPRTRQPMIEFAMKQAIQQDRASQDRVERNINFTNSNQPRIEGNEDGGKVVDQMLAASKKGTF